jgi:hypothetical protein
MPADAETLLVAPVLALAAPPEREPLSAWADQRPRPRHHAQADRPLRPAVRVGAGVCVGAVGARNRCQKASG